MPVAKKMLLRLAASLATLCRQELMSLSVSCCRCHGEDCWTTHAHWLLGVQLDTSLFITPTETGAACAGALFHHDMVTQTFPATPITSSYSLRAERQEPRSFLRKLFGTCGEWFLSFLPRPWGFNIKARESGKCYREEGENGQQATTHYL